MFKDYELSLVGKRDRMSMLTKQETYWQRMLSGELPASKLWSDHPRPPAASFIRGVECASLSADLCRHLQSLCDREHVSLFVMLLATFKTLLYRYTGQEDVIVGAPSSDSVPGKEDNKERKVSNLLALRSDLTGDPSFAQLLTRVAKTVQDAADNRDYPFEELVEQHDSVAVSLIFQTIFGLCNVSPTVSTSPITERCLLDLEQYFNKSDLVILVNGKRDSFALQCQYDAELFEPATITRLLGHYETLLRGVLSDPGQRLSELQLISDGEGRQLVADWNRTERDYPRDKCIHELFEEQVEKTPDAIALVVEDQQLTYRELNNRANQLAYYLRKLGVDADALVGLCMDRSVDMIVAMLGILTAGGAYVPLDPSYPKERLAFMIEDTQVSVILTDVNHAGELPASDARVIRVDDDWKNIGQEGTENPRFSSTPAQLAYVMYTSGSTGRPKGVEVAHRGITRLLFGADYAQLDANQTLLHLASGAFDASTFEIWGALLHGAKCVLYPERVPSAQDLGEIIKRQGVTTLWLTASLFNTVIDEAAETLSGVRQLLIGGEALSVAHVRRGLEWLPHTEIINGYGPTESTTFACCYRIPRKLDQHIRSVPIGRPIGNTKVYILDRHMSPVPIGVAGELYIGGDGLARGYLNRPELTAERFITHSFDGEAAQRLYETGDRARYLQDGNIECLGRLDNQVKIRGYRIELGEIEAVLAQHPAVRESIVIAGEDSTGDKQLVAYIVPRESATATNELRAHLKGKLPEYMVPSVFVALDSLPLTANGKVNRQALPPPDQCRPELEETLIAARNPVEEIIAGIWAGVLKLDKVGIHDNFFELGGHSLLATGVISRVNNAFKINIPLRRLFEAPTVAGLSASIDDSLGIGRDRQSIPPIVPIARSSEIPLSFAQQRLWFLDRWAPGSATYNVPAAFRLVGELNVHALEQSLNEIVRRHEVLRTIFATVHGDPLQKILPPAPLSLTYVDISERPESEREQALSGLAREEAEPPFDLSRGPLLRVQLLRLAPQEHVLLLNMHHIVCDGWSMGVLFRELSILYEGYGSGKPGPLPELPIQYADYSVWQKQWLQGEELERQLSYWRNKLVGLSTLQLPTDHARPAMQTYQGASLPLDLSASLCAAIKTLSQDEGVTPFMTLLAAFQLLLSRYSGQSDIAVGSPIAGRTREETEGLIGFFVNTLVLRTDLSNNPTFKQLLQQVRETTLEAYSHQDLPFEKLVEELHPDRNLSTSPLFQVMFIFQNNADRALEFERLTVSTIRTHSQNAKFDLTLTMSEKEGRLRGSINYNTDLFDESTIERVLGHFQTLLEGIVSNPARCISELPLLTELEKHQLLVEWNDTKSEYPKDKCVHELFEAQVEKTPDSIALVYNSQQLSYRELNDRANQLAHYLRKLGVGPEVLVGICVECSIEMIVGLLGILKAGGAYVPLDPDYPKERLGFMLEDAQVSVLLTQQQVLDRLPEHKVQIVCMDKDREQIAQESDLNPITAVKCQDLAYVIYTSGTSGTPKGVMIEHRSLVNYLCWFNESPLAQTAQSLPVITRTTFDASLKQLFAPLLRGGQVWIPSDDGVNHPVALPEVLSARTRVGLNCVPSLWKAVLEDLTPDRATALRNSLSVLFLGGEQIDRDLVDRTFSAMPEIQIWNLYGPTEATANVCVGIVTPHGALTIGRPIANTLVYILDPHLNPVPIGVRGELHVGGDGLARGYLNRPEWTTEKFITNPFSAETTSLLYKTGDLARYLADGNIEFLGRMDDQVKIRGYRIELGEIEAVLGQLAAVRSSVVVVREDEAGDKRLVGYVVARPEESFDPAEVRKYLKQKLPEYMIPSALVPMDALPLTPNGKIDRGALPAPDRDRRELAQVYRGPRTPSEATLAAIWCEVLKLAKVGIHDNFFDLGGHSLLATQIVSRIRSAFSIEFPLRTLFEIPTVAELAAMIEQNQAKQASDPELAQILREVDAMTEEEAQKIVAE